MITAVLSTAVAFLLFFGKLPLPALIPLCIVLGVLIALLNRHHHDNTLSIDVLAQISRLNKVNPGLKLSALLIAMISCVASQTVFTGLFLLVVVCLLAVCAGGLSLHHYVRVLALPISFLMIGTLALLFAVSSEPLGLLSFNVFGFWLSVTPDTQATAALVVSRAMGAVSCLCLIGLTTPMSEIIGVLRRLHCPEVVIDLMYLIYRYLFILLSVHREMRDAAKSRLGFRNFRNNVRSTGMIYSSLLSRSYHFASRNYDAMESRCYSGGIVFLEHPAPIGAAQVVVAVCLVSACLGLCLSSFLLPTLLPY
ncbi:MAG TPA: cobalt ECF transporter T component CbiQ [Coriobacteriia bacterium]|nr:cobalt ECF transporter T component CbiQ [Coriobacteriia bacterium]